MKALTAKATCMPTSDQPDIDPVIVDAMAGLPSYFDGFGQTFQNDIRPALIAREADRVVAARKARDSMVLGVAVAALGIMVSVFVLRYPMAAMLAGMAGFGIGVWGRRDLTKIKHEAKEMIVNPVAAHLGIGFRAQPGKVTSIDRHRGVKLVPSWDRSKFEDLVTGKRNGVDFELFEAHLEQRRQSSSKNSGPKWVTVFKGQCLRLDFHKQFYGRTLVTRDRGILNRFGGGGGLKRAALEDPRFEKIFEVYTSDQVESRFLLTPDLMQKLVDLEKTFHGGKLKCCFDDGEMLITVQGGDLFEPGNMFTPLDNPARVRELLDDFVAVFDVIDAVNEGRQRREETRNA